MRVYMPVYLKFVSTGVGLELTLSLDIFSTSYMIPSILVDRFSS